MTTNDKNPALVAWVAEHVMGWKCYHVGKQGDGELTDDYQAVVFYDKDGGKLTSVSKWDNHSSLDMEPWNPLADANHDFEVLRKVREWESRGGLEGCVAWYDFWRQLAKVLHDRQQLSVGYCVQDLRDMQAYQCGDFCRTAAKAKGWTEQ